MKYFSTRDHSKHFSFSEALKYGLAPDGGLFLPEKLEKVQLIEFNHKMSFADFADKLLSPFVSGDEGLEDRLPEICQSAFQFSIPLRFRKERFAILELFHGPTSAFKDVGAC